MYTRVTKKALLLLATSLLLTGCTEDPTNSTSNENSDTISNTSMDESYTSDNSGSIASGTSSEKSSIDYTQGWDPAVDAEIRRSL